MDNDVRDVVGHWLVFGLSGQVGEAFATLRSPTDPPWLAPSRSPRRALPGVRWVQAGLGDVTLPDVPVTAIASLGPLDAFVDWIERTPVAPERVVALGSTSVHAKRDSGEPAERALALALRTAELRLAAVAAERGFVLTVLRPTLVYGNGRDRNLSRLVAAARRWRLLPLPAGARGLRQPVHVEDVAAAVPTCPAAKPCPSTRWRPGRSPRVRRGRGWCGCRGSCSGWACAACACWAGPRAWARASWPASARTRSTTAAPRGPRWATRRAASGPALTPSRGMLRRTILKRERDHTREHCQNLTNN